MPVIDMHPLQALFDEIDRRLGGLAVNYRPTLAYGAGGLPSFLQPDAVAHMIAAQFRRYDTTDIRFAVSRIVADATRLLVHVGMGPFFARHAVPLLHPDGARLSVGPHGHFQHVTLTSPRFYYWYNDDNPLVSTGLHQGQAVPYFHPPYIFREHLIAQLSPLIAALAPYWTAGPRALWLAAADQYALEALHLGQQLIPPHLMPSSQRLDFIRAHVNPPLRDKAHVLYARNTEMLAVSAHEDGVTLHDAFVLRTSCCFIDRTRYMGRPVQRCMTCPAHGFAKRKALLAAHLARRFGRG